MLQSINDRIKGWLAWVIAVVVALTFGLWGIESYLEGRSTPKKAIAKVNGYKISVQEFEIAYAVNKREQQVELGIATLLPNADAVLRARTLQQLVIAALLQQDALRQSMIVSREQVESDVAEMPFFQIDGQFSQQAFQQAVRSTGYTVDGFLNELQRGQLVDQFRAGVAGSAFALPSDVKKAIKLLHQERSFRYLLLPAQQFFADVQISAEEVEQYYQQHQAIFTSPEQVAIEYIQLNLADMAEQIEITDEVLAAYYHDNIDRFDTGKFAWHIARIYIYLPTDATDEQRIAAEEKITSIQQALANDVAFAEVAERYSDDPLSAQRGGELPWFTSGVVDSDLEAIATELQMGDVSEPVRTATGFEIVQLLDVREPRRLSLEEAKEEIWEQLRVNQASQLYANQLEQLADITFTSANSLEPAAEALGLEINTTDFFTIRGEEEGLLANPDVLDAVFSDDVLGSGFNSNVIQLDAETALVLRVKTHKPKAQLPFAEMEDAIRQTLVHQAAADQANQIGTTIVQQFNGDDDAQALLDEHGLAWSEQHTITRTQAELNPGLIDFVFQLPAPQVNMPIPVVGRHMESGAYLIVQLESVLPGSLEEVAKDERQTLRDQIEYGNGIRDYNLYRYHLLQSAKIKVYDPELKDVF